VKGITELLFQHEKDLAIIKLGINTLLRGNEYG